MRIFLKIFFLSLKSKDNLTPSKTDKKLYIAKIEELVEEKNTIINYLNMVNKERNVILKILKKKRIRFLIC